MNCPNCGKKIEEDYFYCSNCGRDLTDLITLKESEYAIEKGFIDYIMIVFCSLAFILSLIPISKTIITLGIILSIVTLIVAIYQKFKKAHIIWAKVSVFSITLIIINFSWFLFFNILF